MSQKQRLIAKIQSILGVSYSELIVVIVLLSGLTVGLIAKKILNSQHSEIYYEKVNGTSVDALLDSISKAEESTFTGVTPDGKSVPELAIGDTIVKKEERFPTSKKKELPSGKININTATKAELMKLPGVGEAMAERILEYRKNERFIAPDDMKRIKGVGDKKFEKIRPFVIVK